MIRKSLAIIKTIICFEKQRAIKLEFEWKKLWDCFFLILRLLTTTSILSPAEMIPVCLEVWPLSLESPCWVSKGLIDYNLQITTMLNFFITYGDTFLHSTNYYDELYYELVRNSKFLEVLSMTGS